LNSGASQTSNATLATGLRSLRQMIVARGAESGGERVWRVEVPVDGVEPLSFLAAQRPGQRSYFRSRDGITSVAMVGAACTFESPSDPLLRAMLATDPSILAFLAGRFDSEREPGLEWSPFGRAQVILPAVELRRVADRVTIAAVGIGEGRSTLEALDRIEDAERLHDPANSVPEFTPGFGAEGGIDSSEDAWNVAVNATLAEIGTGSVRKIVLARTRTFRLSEPADPCELLSRLGESEPGTYQFMIEPAPGIAFVGASPERLFQREGERLESEALAGTRPRGETPEVDWSYAQDLFGSEKDRREHALVLDRIRERLDGVVTSMRVARGARLLRLARVQHLCTPVQATVRANVPDAELLARLHPTPAVCGQPAERARMIIRACEPFDRGLYAGPIGLLGRTTEVCVGIRSALVIGDSVIAFAGAGIVAGSDAHAEWRETEHKLATIERLVRPS
jgi:menaquinone-specific isochorismate synthase